MVGGLNVYAALSFWSEAKILEAIAHRFHRERAEQKGKGKGKGEGGTMSCGEGRYEEMRN